MELLEKLKSRFYVDEPAGILTRLNGNPAGTISPRGYTSYIRVNIDHKLYYAHRLIWMLRNERDVPDGMVIDHDDGNGLNNASYNHKMGTRGRNQRNVRKRIDNISGETGISWNDRRKIWEADVSIDGVRKRKSSKDRNKLSEWVSMTRKNSGEFSLRHGK